MIVMNEPFPESCGVCPIRMRIGCQIARLHGISSECPFEPAEPVIPESESCGIFGDSQNGYTVAELICLMCLKRFVNVRPDGLLLKDMECPGCHKTGFLIETGEYLMDDQQG